MAMPREYLFSLYFPNVKSAFNAAGASGDLENKSELFELADERFPEH